MKTHLLTFYILCSFRRLFSTAFLLFLPVFSYADIPDCLSESSDPDGDGWGWENNKSCKVNRNPACLDPDGDGWGWDGTKSCEINNVNYTAYWCTSGPEGYRLELDLQGQGAKSHGVSGSYTRVPHPSTQSLYNVVVSTDRTRTLQDNNGDMTQLGSSGEDGSHATSCQILQPLPSEPEPASPEPPHTLQQTGIAAELVGAWQCYVGAVVPDWYLFRNFSMETNDALAFAGGCHQIGMLTSVLEGSQCDISWKSLIIQYSHHDGSFNDHLSRLVLNDDLTGTVQDGQVQTGAGEAYYVNPVEITWQMEGYQLTIDNTPAHRIAFETWNGNEYFSYYSDDENRTTCQKENP